METAVIDLGLVLQKIYTLTQHQKQKWLLPGLRQSRCTRSFYKCRRIMNETADMNEELYVNVIFINASQESSTGCMTTGNS